MSHVVNVPYDYDDEDGLRSDDDETVRIDPFDGKYDHRRSGRVYGTADKLELMRLQGRSQSSMDKVESQKDSLPPPLPTRRHSPGSDEHEDGTRMVCFPPVPSNLCENAFKNMPGNDEENPSEELKAEQNEFLSQQRSELFEFYHGSNVFRHLISHLPDQVPEFDEDRDFPIDSNDKGDVNKQRHKFVNNYVQPKKDKKLKTPDWLKVSDDPKINSKRRYGCYIAFTLLFGLIAVGILFGLFEISAASGPAIVGGSGGAIPGPPGQP